MATPKKSLAPPQGFEPRNVGIKIRCLNQLGEEGIVGRGTWNRTKIYEFKARCIKPLYDAPTEIKQDAFFAFTKKVKIKFAVSILKNGAATWARTTDPRLIKTML